MSAWITDRVPTHEDADFYKLVWFTDGLGSVRQVHYRYLKLGTPWQPITYPEPYVKPKVWEVGPFGYTKAIARNRCVIQCMSQQFTDAQLQAMNDALNKLEDSHD